MVRAKAGDTHPRRPLPPREGDSTLIASRPASAGTLPRWDYARRTATVLELLPQLRLAELVSHRFPITQAAAAYALLDQAPPGMVQVMVEYG